MIIAGCTLYDYHDKIVKVTPHLPGLSQASLVQGCPSLIHYWDLDQSVLALIKHCTEGRLRKVSLTAPRDAMSTRRR